MFPVKKMQEWIMLGQRKSKYYFFYEEKVLDLTTFLDFHPGGKKALVNYIYKDITDIIFAVYHHNPDNTLKTLFKYQIGSLPEEEVSKKSNLKRNNKEVNADKEKRKVGFNKKEYITEEEESVYSACKENRKTQQKTISKNSSKEKSKSKVKRTVVSIKTISEKSLEETKKSRSKSKGKSKNNSKKKIKGSNTSLKTSYAELPSATSWRGDEIDECKPVFKVPIMQINAAFKEKVNE